MQICNVAIMLKWCIYCFGKLIGFAISDSILLMRDNFLQLDSRKGK